MRKRKLNRIALATSARTIERLELRQMLASDGLLPDVSVAVREFRQPVADFISRLANAKGVELLAAAGAGDVVYRPVMQAGSANGTPPDSPQNRVDPNDGTSRFGGVGSLSIQHPTLGTFLCTGSTIAERFVLSAAHCFDYDDDGDLDPGITATYILNNGADNSSSHVISSVNIHPDFEGFVSQGGYDDLSVLELATPVPQGTPIYSLRGTPLVEGEVIEMVGYGLSGDGDTGFTVGASFNVKRSGKNVVDQFIEDDEPPLGPEIYIFDFDGEQITGLLGDGTLGNTIESYVGSGDSGSPAFADVNGQLMIVGVGTLQLTFAGTIPAPGFFGSIGGGINVGLYGDWISNILDPNAIPVGVNDQIELAEGGISTMLVGGATSVLANDTGLSDLPISVSLVSGPTHATHFVLNSDGTFSYTHDGSENFGDAFQYRITDGDNETSVATVQITISPVSDQQPSALADEITVAEGGTATTLVGGAGSVVANDTGLADTPIAVSLVTGPLHATNFALLPDGTFSYTHDGSEVFTDAFEYRITDNDQQSSVNTVQITITPFSDAFPVATDDLLRVFEGELATELVGGATTVLANDTGLTDSPITVSLVSPPLRATSFQLNANGTFVYQHDGSPQLTDAFVYRITDRDGETSTATVQIEIIPVNGDIPNAEDDLIEIQEGGTSTTLVGGAASVLANDTGLTDTPITLAIVTGPVHATAFALHGDGTFSYQHNGSENFTDSFQYRVSDRDGESSIATVRIQIAPVSDTSPVALDDQIQVVEGGTSILLVGGERSVLANDQGLLDTPIVVAVEQGPARATAFQLNADGSFLYQHNGTEFTTDSFRYRITDNDGQSKVATVRIIITPASDALPAAVADQMTVKEGGIVTLLDGGAASVLANDTGLTDTPIAVTLIDGPAHASGFSLNPDGTFSYKHDGTETFIDFFRYRITDADLESSETIVSIRITPVSDEKPNAVNDKGEVKLGGVLTSLDDGSLSVLDNDTGLADTPIVITVESAPQYASSFVLNPDGTFKYVHDAARRVRQDRFSYRITDNDGQTSVGIVRIELISDSTGPVDDLLTIEEGGKASTLEDGSTSVLDNDGRLAKLLVVAELVSKPQHAARFEFNEDGTFVYAHDGSENFEDSFVYRVRNRGTDFGTATVVIQIKPVSDTKPQAIIDFVTVAEGSSVDAVDAFSVLANDQGLLDTPIVVSLVGKPAFASEFSLSEDGIFTYQHDGSENFSDEAVYQITDNDGQVSRSIIRIKITPVSDTTPRAIDDKIVVTQGEGTKTLFDGSTSLLANDLGLQDTPVAVSLITAPQWAVEFSLNAQGEFAYKHDGSDHLQDSFTYAVTDNDGETSKATVHVTVLRRVALEPPVVKEMVLNEGVDIHNLIKVLDLRFSQPVKVEQGALVVINTTTSKRFETTNVSISTSDAGHRVRWNLGELDLPIPGKYQFILRSQGVISKDGIELDGDGDGKPGGDYRSELVPLTWAGDTDLDLDVDFADFLALSANYSRVGTNWSQGNFNQNQEVDFRDFLLLSRNFGKTWTDPGTWDDSDGGGSVPVSATASVDLALETLDVSSILGEQESP